MILSEKIEAAVSSALAKSRLLQFAREALDNSESHQKGSDTIVRFQISDEDRVGPSAVDSLDRHRPCLLLYQRAGQRAQADK